MRRYSPSCFGQALTGLVGAALLPVFLSSPALAMDVSLQLGSPFTWAGEGVVLQVSVINPDRGISAPELPPVAGLVIRGPSRPMQQVQTINGQSTVSFTFQYEVTPAQGKTGKFTLGPVTVAQQGGASVRSNAVELQVYKKPPPGIRMGCEVTPHEGHVGQAFRVVYTVYYTGDAGGEDDDFSFFAARSAPLGLTEMSLPILHLSGMRLTPVAPLERQQASRISFRDGGFILVQQGFGEDKEGYGYKTLAFGFEVVPSVTGPIKISGATVGMRLKTGKVKRGRDFFRGVIEVPDPEDFKASTEDYTYTVRDLPEEGRPPGFSGAVGKFQIRVKATPVEVDSFAPVNLEVRVFGDGILEDLKPPVWTEVESLTKDFDVSTDVDSGKMEGREKVFHQVIRPRSGKVTQIPPIPFPYFDPSSGKYQVARSEPIPIKVRAVETAEVDSAISKARAAAQPSSPSRAQASSIVEQRGIGANFEEIGSARASMDPQEEILSAPFLAAVLAPPLILLALHLTLKASKRDPRLRAKDRALKQASRQLSQAGLGSDQAAQAYQEYFRERLGLPGGEITPTDLTSELARHRVPLELCAAATRLLERLLASRFGGGGEGAEKLTKEALKTLAEIHPCVRD